MGIWCWGLEITCSHEYCDSRSEKSSSRSRASRAASPRPGVCGSFSAEWKDWETPDSDSASASPSLEPAELRLAEEGAPPGWRERTA